MNAIALVPEDARALAGRPSVLVSLVAHSGLVLLAALGSSAPPPTATALTDTTIYLPVDPLPRPRGLPGRLPRRGSPMLVLPSVLLMPTAIPLPDLLPPGVPSAPWTTESWSAALGAPGDTVTGTPGTAVDASVVEERPVLLSYPALHYPEILRQAGIEGDVTVEAVLDTLGRVEPGSAHVTRGAHALMDAEALAVVRGSVYRPGRMGPRAVRVRIQVPVRFALRR